MAYLVPDNLRTRADASSGVQSAARALHMALDEDCTVWYEPPYDADGKRPDLVVMMNGCGLVAFEVLKLGRKKFLAFFDGGVRLERDNSEIKVDSPLVRAVKLSRSFEKAFAASPVISAAGPTVKPGIIFPNLGRDEAISKGVERLAPLETCLFKEDIESAHTPEGGRAMTRWFVTVLGGTRNDWTEDQERAIRAVIHPETVIARGAQPKLLDSAAMADLKVMDRRQEGFAKSLGSGHRVIRGVAGSGKTVILLHRARLLSRCHKKWRILVTCYTRSLASWLQGQLESCGNVDVINLDSLMASQIRRAGVKHPGYDGDDSGERVARVALQAATGNYDVVLVDEAQDFATSALKFALAMLRDGRDDLLVVADAAQNIFRRQFNWKSAGIQAQGRTRILRKNYRNTREILDFAHRFLTARGDIQAQEQPDLSDETVVIPPEAAARSGPEPQVRLVSTEANLGDEVLQGIRRIAGDARKAGIAVLYPTSAFGGRGAAARLARGIKASGLSVHLVSDRASKDALSRTTADVVLSTIHSAKGLEWPTVMVVGLDHPYSNAESERKLAYVAMTRATERLFVFAPRHHPLAQDVEGAAKQGRRGE